MMKLVPVLRIVVVVHLGLLSIWYVTRFGHGKSNNLPSTTHLGTIDTVQTLQTCKSLAEKPFEEVSSDAISICHQTEPFLISYIKRKHVFQPSTLPYTFSRQGKGEIIEVLLPILQRETKGQSKKIFAEAGALDGIITSNTVWLEESASWTGVLIECHPEAVATLLTRHRKAYVVNACLSKTEFPSKSTLTSVDGWHASSSLGEELSIFPSFARNFTKYEVQTLPLYSILAALDITVVDFLSLDIQSMEPYVIRTFPFDLIHVKVWVVEVHLITTEEKNNLVEFMASKGYRVSNMLDKGKADLVFIHRRK